MQTALVGLVTVLVLVSTLEIAVPPFLSCTTSIVSQSFANCTIQFEKSVTLNVQVSKQEDKISLQGVADFLPARQIFGVGDLAVKQLSIFGTLKNHKWQQITLQGVAQTKHVEFAITSNLLEGMVRLDILNAVDMLQVVQDLGIPIAKEVVSQVQVLVHDVSVLLLYKELKHPKVEFEVAVKTTVFDISLHARAKLKLSLDEAELDGKLEKLLHFGPFAVNAVGFLLSVSKQSQGLTIYGSVDFWHHHNLNASVELKHLEGKNFGYKLKAEIEHLKLDEFLPAIRTIPMANHLKIGHSGIVYSSYPIPTPDGILRKGLALYTGLVMYDGPLAGFNRVLGGKNLELPCYLNLGELISGWDMKDLRITSRVPFDFPIRTHYFGYSGPLGLSIGFAPFGCQATMGFVVRFPFDEQDLKFLVALDVDVTNAKGMAECSAGWHNPFGIQQLTLRNVAADIAINYYTIAETYTPNRIAITGDVDFPGLGRIRLSFMYDLVPSFNFAFVGHLGKSFALSSVIETANAFFKLSIPPFIPDLFRISELELYISPRGATIGSIDMPMGIGYSFQLELFGHKIYGAKVHISTTQVVLKAFSIGFNIFDLVKLDDITFDLVASPMMQYFKMHTLLTLNVPCLDTIQMQASMQANLLGIDFVVQHTVLVLRGSIATMNPKNMTLQGSFNSKIIDQLSNIISTIIETKAKLLQTIEDDIRNDLQLAESFKSKMKQIIVPKVCKFLRLPFESLEDGKWIDRAMEHQNQADLFLPPTPKRVCERVRDKLQQVVNKVKQVATHVANLRRQLQDLTAHISVRLLRQKVFRITQIEFNAQLQDIKTNGYVNVHIHAHVLNKKKRIALKLQNVNQVLSIAERLVKYFK